MAKKSTLIQQLKKFFKQHGWDYMVTENHVLRGLMTGETGHWHWAVKRTLDERFVMFCAYCPVKIPARRLAAAAEYLTYANWSLQFGSFDMDWADGQVICRTSIPLTGPVLHATALEHLFFANCAFMDRYLPGLMAVALTNVKPAQAFADAEREPGDKKGEPAPPPEAAAEIPGQVTPSRLDGLLPGNN